MPKECVHKNGCYFSCVKMCSAMPKRKSQLVDARASKNVKMAEPEVAFH